jgi:hypothetical protein
LFLGLSNCASVREKNFDNYENAQYVRENCGMYIAAFHFHNPCITVTELKKCDVADLRMF